MLPIEDRELLNQTLAGLNVHPESIASLLTSFDYAAEDLESNPVPPVPKATLGDSYTGGYRLATNVKMAHEAIYDELMKMAAGLRGMAVELDKFQKEVVVTTEQTQATMRQYEAATECVSAPKIDTGSCSLPNDSKD